jgi:hypothetical protein
MKKHDSCGCSHMDNVIDGTYQEEDLKVLCTLLGCGCRYDNIGGKLGQKHDVVVEVDSHTAQTGRIC